VAPAELRQRAVELEADLWRDAAEDRRGAAELLAAFADYDPVLLRTRATRRSRFRLRGVGLLADARIRASGTG